MMYQWIHAKHDEEPSLPISRLCSALGVSRSGYYSWLGRKDVPVPDKDLGLRHRIHEIVLEFPGYGYRRVTHALHRCDWIVNHKRVLRLMGEENILCRPRKRIVRTTNSKHDLGIYENLAGSAEVTGVNQLWVADITYIGLPDEYIYLVSLIDAYSRKCVGWHIDDRLDTSLALTA